MDKEYSKSDSRTWPEYVDESVLVVDAWQGKVLNRNEAYKNKYIMNNGKSKIRHDTHSYTPHQKGYENIKDRNLVWDSKSKQWKCKSGYVKKFSGVAFLGYCVPKE